MSDRADNLHHLPLGRLPSGIYILTVGEGNDSTGMLASWVQQAAFEPPMVSVALKRGRHISERIEAGEPFVLNVVGEGHKSLLKHFAKDTPFVHLDVAGCAMLNKARLWYGTKGASGWGVRLLTQLTADRT